MKIKFYKNYLLYIFTAFFLYSCDSSSTSSYSVDNGDNNMGGGSDDTELPAGFTKFISEYTDVYVSGDYVIIESTGVPNHSSPYWGAGHANYSSPHSGMTVNPNRISEDQTKKLEFILSLHKQGLGYRRIAKVLNEKGIRTHKGSVWGGSYGYAVLKRYRERLQI